MEDIRNSKASTARLAQHRDLTEHFPLRQVTCPVASYYFTTCSLRKHSDKLQRSGKATETVIWLPFKEALNGAPSMGAAIRLAKVSGGTQHEIISPKTTSELCR